ncbi:hypothetical protein ACFB49_04450 [Sphingomonas sp. DBB INV C78]|uniref:hypothetical protein n=1 Tax=Sphingomonas sp. DBB INV C78 TaxID=3349434 RepID=UPI0036D4172D
MFNIISIIIGVVAAILAIPSFLPFLGIGNWLVILIAFVGLVFGLISRSKGGQTLNIVVMCFAGVRLFLGGGII